MVNISGYRLPLAIVALLLAGWLSAPAAWGQQRRTVQVNTKAPGNPDTVLFKQFWFWNLNKIDYYYDLKKRKQIDRLERREDFRAATDLMAEYVANFGIQNFYKETNMLWRLGQLYERSGRLEEAKAIYRLVLKHHRGDISDILLYYDSMIELEKDYFIPLDYYYELVEYRRTIDTLRPPRGVLINMGEEVNSAAPDYAPSLSADNETMFFSSQRNTRSGLTAQANEDIFVSRRGDGYWDFAEPFTELNTRFNEGSVALSPDGQTLYFGRCESPDSYGSCDIFQATKQDNGKWGDIRNLGPNINGSRWDSQPALSATGDTLYFASDRLGGFGLSDLYFSHKNARGQWTKAQNMGPVINTRGNEVSPFVHPRYNVFYFSSNGHLVNFGDFDIYKSYWKEDLWREPINIGPLVNGEGSEYYFTIDAESKDLFYARSERSDLKNLELYSFPLPMGAQPLATTRFSGQLTDSVTGEAFTGIVSIIDLDNGVEIAPKALRPDGTFDFDLIKDNNYLLVIQGDDFFRIEEMFYLSDDTSIVRKAESVRSKKIQFASLEFEGGSAQISSAMRDDLDHVFDFLVDNPGFRLRISGHTDSQGDADLNMRLSQRRAEAIKKYLTRSGHVDADRVEARGYGSTVPIRWPEKSEEDRRTNRRVEFELIAPE